MAIGDVGTSFVGNPLVQAIGNAVGLAPLMAAAGTPASYSGPAPRPMAVPPPKPPVPAAKTAAVRESMDVRQHYARPSTRGLTPGGSGNPGLNLPGVMSPDVLQHPVVQALLNQYGVSPASVQNTVENASPDMFITNPAAYQRHPVLAGMLEHGLEGAAFTHGSNTWGEGISNVAQGLLNANAARATKYNNQLMMPMEQASQVAGLQSVANQQAFQNAQAKRDNAMSDYYAKMGDVRGQLADIRQQQAAEAARMERWRENQSLIKEVSTVPLNKDEQAKLNDAATKAGGDLYNVDPAIYRDVFSSAKQRQLDALEAGKTKRAEIGADTRIKTTQINSAAKGSTPSAKYYEDTYNNAVKDLGAFKAAIAGSKMATGPDGTVYFPGDDVTPAIKAYQKTIQDANDNWLKVTQTNPMAVPGSGMTKPNIKKKIPTYGIDFK